MPLGTDWLSHIHMTTVDYLSDYFDINELQWLESWRNVSPPMEFLIYFHSDNGPPFNLNEFSGFASMYKFEHMTSSLGYLQSKSKVENAVKTSKNLVKKAASNNSDFQLALHVLAVLDWQNTPTECMKSSPAQRMFGRCTRTLLLSSKELRTGTPASQRC